MTRIEEAPRQQLAALARGLSHALDPAQWAVDVLDWQPDPWQADLMRSTAPQVCVLCSRQSGKSTTVAALAAHTAIFQAGSLSLLTSPTLRQASELLTKVRNVLTKPALKINLAQDAATSLELPNGSRIVSLPATPEAIRGYSAPTLVIEDEAAFIPDELHQALRPMLATSKNGRFILLSTPAGRAGHFFEAAHSPNWLRFKVTARECPRITKQFLDNELLENGDLYFNREFLCEFSDSEFSFFGSDLIASSFECDEQPIKVRLFT